MNASDLDAYFNDALSRAIGGEVFSDCTSGTNASIEGLTFAKLEEMTKLIESFRAPPPRVEWMETTDAGTWHQTRVYPRRKARTSAHLKRMNNKWLKRYGKTFKPGVLAMDIGAWAIGGPKKVFLVHPLYMPTFRASLQV